MLDQTLDPWRVIRSFLGRINSREVPDVIDGAGLVVNWALTQREDVSHSTRWAAYRPRIDAAYADLASDNDRLRVAFIVAGELSRRGLEGELNEALGKIGWQIRDAALRAVGGSVRELFFPDGSHHDAYVEIRSILQEASSAVDVVDPYVDGSILTLLTASAKPGMRFRVLTSKHPADFALEANKWKKQNADSILEIRTTREFHDRFVIVDGQQCWHIGASIKDAGNKVFMLSQVEDPENQSALLNRIQTSWDNGTPL